MIGSLRGRLLERTLRGEVLVEVAGVGYRVTLAPATAASLGELDSEIFLWVHHHVREDAQILYGFATRDQRQAFEALLGAHGVGPSLALAILGVHQPDALRQVLAEDDLAALCLVPGVGKKTAARLLVELKSRLEVPDDPAAAVGAAGAGASSRSDVREALSGLGYGAEEIAEVLRGLPHDDDTGALLRMALQALGARR